MPMSFPIRPADSRMISRQHTLGWGNTLKWKRAAGIFLVVCSAAVTTVGCAQENQLENVDYEAVATGKNAVFPSNTAPLQEAGEPGTQPGHDPRTSDESLDQLGVATEAPVPDINVLSDDKKSQDPSKDSMSELVAVRVGEHTTYDRVVLEFTGPGTPGYRTQYLSKPTRQVSGKAVDIEGETALNVDVTGTTMPVNVAVTPVDPVPGKGNIVKVIPAGTFEDNSQFIVDMKTARPYTVTLMENPTRVVIDFQK